MSERQPNETPRFYFALPRLFASLRGRSAERTEGNWFEANLVGTLEHLVVFLFAFHLLIADLPVGKQLLLLLPLALLVWIFWLILLYANSLVIRLLRVVGVMHALPQSRAQTILIGIAASACAIQLAQTGLWSRRVGEVWLTLVALNLLASFALQLRKTKRK